MLWGEIMQTIKFKYDFKKLENDEFLTIRRTDKGSEIGQSVIIKSPSMEFLANVVEIEKIMLGDISTIRLARDLDLMEEYDKVDLIDARQTYHFKQKCLEKLKEFYKDIKWNDCVYIFTIKAKRNRGG